MASTGANEEEVLILNVKTGEAVENISDLRTNITELKKQLKELEGAEADNEDAWKQYQDTLAELKVNQNALKDAMYATKSSFADVTNGAKGATTSYNSLVHQMATLKEEFRSTTDEMKRNSLGTQINEINTKLKEMDALQGNFQRNVGNYQSVFKGFAEKTDAFGKGLNVAEGSVNGFKDGFEALGKSPYIATFSILLSVVMKLAEGMKENESVMGAVKKAGEALKPVMNFLSGIMSKLGEWIGNLIGKVVQFVNKDGLFDKILNGVAGVGNAIEKLLIMPTKVITNALVGLGKTIRSVFKGDLQQARELAKNTVKGIEDDFKSGISFKANFDAGKEIVEKISEGAKSEKEEAHDAGKEVGEEMGDGISEGLELADWRKALEAGEKVIADEKKKRAEEVKGFDEEIESEYQSILESIDDYYAELEDMRLKDSEDEKAKAKEKINTLFEVANATSSLLSSLADMYDADEENSEKNAKKVKALRIASATIDTISGAISAFMSCQESYPQPYGTIIGAIQSATVLATGIAQIAKIKNTDATGESTASLSSGTSAVASAPTLTTSVANVRNVTTASEEERLNQIASEQRVYILSSDIEASQNQTKVRVAEASF